MKAPTPYLAQAAALIESGRVEEAQTLMRREGIHSINSTTKSIEEIATTILRELRIHRQVY